MKKDIPKYLTHSGPGDDSKPGNINTEEWWKSVSDATEASGKAKPTYLHQPVDTKSIIQQAKDKDIWFCTIPFTQVYSEITGKFSACCFGKQSEKHNVENTSLREWMEDSEYLNSIRKEMLDPNTNFKAVNEICKRCRMDEDRYGRSRRTSCLKIHTNDPVFWDDIQKSVEMYKQTLEFKFEYRTIEIQLKIFGSECNLDCFMCHHANSTTRQKVMSKGVWNDKVWGKQNSDKVKFIQEVMKDKTKGMIEQVEELLPYVRSIKIIGGEPFVMKKQYELLQKVIDSGHAKHIILKYQTNLTKTKKGKHNAFNYLPHFKRVYIVVSVDGIGKTIEYMRRRTDWNEVLENINLCKQHPNIKVDFNGLVTNLSVLRFYEIIDWCKANPVINGLNWAMIEEPTHFRPNNLPEEIKKELIPKYTDWPDIVAALERPADFDFNIQNVFDYMLHVDEFYKGTKWEMNFFDIFPELNRYYKPNENGITPEQRELFTKWDQQAKREEEIVDQNIV